MLVAEFIKILKKANDLQDLSRENVIEKIKNEFTLAIKQEKDQTKCQAIQVAYKSWEDDDFDIDHSFENKFRCDHMIKCTLLHLTAMNGHTKLVDLLLDKGANVNAVENKHRCTPLHLAAMNGHTEVVEFLLGKKADVNKVDDKYRWTPLHWAARNGHIKIAELLLDKGANVNAADDKRGLTPLHLAALNGFYTITTPDEDKTTYTTLNGSTMYTEMVKLLLQNNANPLSKNYDNKVPREYATGIAYNGEVKKLLEEAEEKAKMPVNNGGANPLLESNKIKTPTDFVEGKEMTKPSQEAEKACEISVTIGFIVSVISTALIVVLLTVYVEMVAELHESVIALIAVGCGIAIGAAFGCAAYMLLKPSTEIKVEHNVEKSAEQAIAA
ncbi:ankyrin repeat domain-containing protein [Wolbachia endosymbiont of Folsomia candida]|uniref:ankyrin repeat domain-containing protein n=1 Tax=Wolbachia endosymbiont of Folsomia candida TaxID=169402 RepID=UPI000A839430|nr:ankyrin repeat domain-containing protein [Wolbachia endosymbiont of Folsomia candida]APR98328.1 hypothetical protein ASM33_03440 [Wolbachia endosymbiont of Folsomia candida]